MKQILKRMLAFTMACNMIFTACLNGFAMDLTLATENETTQSIIGESEKIYNKTENIIEISSVDDLMKISNDLDGHFKLMKDIDLGGKDWAPIGTEERPFSGIFDGNGHIIKNFIIKNVAAKQNTYGLFGVMENAKVNNLALQGNITVISHNKKNAIGLLAGIILNSSVENCAFSTKMNYINKNEVIIVGMIAGQVKDGSIFVKNCYENSSEEIFGKIDANVHISKNELHSLSLENLIKKTGFAFEEEKEDNAKASSIKMEQNSTQIEKGTQQEQEEKISKEQEDNAEETDKEEKSSICNTDTDLIETKMITDSLNTVENITTLPDISLNTFQSDIYSGTCGDNLTWTVDGAGTLTISGTGDMYNFWYSPGFADNVPWGMSTGLRNVIKKVIVEEGVTSIGSDAMTLPNMMDISLPSTLKTINEDAFHYCNSLIELIIPDGVTTLGRFSIHSCDQLEKLVIPSSVDKIGRDIDGPILDCPKLISAGPIGGSDNIQYKWIESIPEKAFSGMDSLKMITLPEKLRVLNSFCLYRTGIEEIVIPEGVEEIGMYAFSDCEYLESCIIPEAVKEMEGNCFEGCIKLKTAGPIKSNTDIQFGWLDNIPSEAFNYSELEEIIFPQTLSSIGSEAFAYSKKLREVILPDSIRDIGKGAFEYCTKMEKIELPSSITAINEYLLYGCSSLQSLEIPDQVTEIGESAFARCSSLSSCIIPKSVKKIHILEKPSINDFYGIFSDCEQLKTVGPIGGGYNIKYGWDTEIPDNVFCGSMIENVTIEDSVQKIGQKVFEDCNNLEIITIPNSVIQIGEAAFAYCDNLEKIFLPQNLSKMDSTIYDCGKLEKMIIPENVGEMYESFSDCNSLTTICFLGNAPKIDEDCFEELDVTAYYPENNETWSEEVRNSFGGDITWVPYTAQKAANEETEKSVKINYAGSAMSKFYLSDNEGNALPFTEFTYTYSYDGKQFMSHRWHDYTDAEGGYTFDTPDFGYKQSGDNSHDITYKVDLVNNYQSLRNKEFTIHATVTPLVYTETWGFSLDTNISVDALGLTKGKGSNGSISLYHKEDGTDELTLSLTLSSALEEKLAKNVADFLPSVKDQINGTGLSVGEASGSGKFMEYKTYSTTINDFDMSNSDCKEKMACFLWIIIHCAAFNNVMVNQTIDGIGLENVFLNSFEINESGIEASLKANSSSLKLSFVQETENGLIDVSLLSPVKLNSFSSEAAYKYSTIVENGKYTYMTGITTKNGYSAFSGLGSEMLGYLGFYGFSRMNDTTVTANADKITLKTCDYDSGFQPILEDPIYTYRAYIADGEAVDTLKQNTSLSKLQKGVLGVTSYDSLCEMIQAFMKTTEQISYSDTEKFNTAVYWNPSVNVKVSDNAGGTSELDSSKVFSLGLDFSMSASIESEVANGVYKSGEREQRAASSDGLNQAKIKATDLNTLLDGAWEGFQIVFGEQLIAIGNSIKEGVQYGTAKIAEIADSAYDWTVSVICMNQSNNAKSKRSASSYQVQTYAAEEDELKIASSIGYPYMVNVTDAEGNEIKDFSGQPLELSLSFTENEITEAGYQTNDIEKLAIYLYDSENDAYSYVGGVLNEEENSITADITKSGQYILIVDGAAPIVKNISVSNFSAFPTISANITDNSDIKYITMLIDDKELINEDNYKEYYNKRTGDFSYDVTDSLTVGEHVVIFIVEDYKGNKTEDTSFSFVVSEVPVFSDISMTEVAISGDTVQIAADVLASGDDNEIATVRADILVTYEDYTEKNLTLYLKNNTKNWTLEFPVDKNTRSYNVTLTATDNLGNQVKTDSMICNIPDNNYIEYEKDGVVFGVNLKKGIVSIVSSSKSVITVPDNIYNHEIKKFSEIKRSAKEAIQKVYLPESIKIIDNMAFQDCTALVEISLSENLEKIGNSAFSGCSSLESIIIPEKVTKIGKYAFANCSKLEELIFPENVKEIGDDIVYNSINLKKLYFTGKAPTFSSFMYSDNIEKIYYPSGERSWDSIIKNCMYDISWICWNPETGRLATDLSDSQVILDETEYIYDGMEKRPSVTVSLNNVSLLENIHYRVEYENNKKPGTGRVIVIGIGDYYGEIIKTFIINGECVVSDWREMESEHLYANNADQSWTYVEPGENVNDLYITFNKSTCISSGDILYVYDGSGNLITDSNNSYLANEIIHVPGNTIKIRLVSDNENTAWGFKVDNLSTIKPPTQISSCYIDLNKYSFSYDGTEKKPKIVIMDGAYTLIEGMDYTLSFDNDIITAGQKTVTINGINQYEGSEEVYYWIGNDIAYCDIELEEHSFLYDGTEKKPGIIVKDEGDLLEEGQDYIINYVDNIEVGSASIKIEGINSYYGETEEYFTIFDSKIFNISVYSALESNHDYEDCIDYTWIYTSSKKNVESLLLSFDEKTFVEDGYDYIYIYDGQNNLIDSYTGLQLAGETVHVDGSIAKIRLITDTSNTAWGFKVNTLEEKIKNISSDNSTETPQQNDNTEINSQTNIDSIKKEELNVPISKILLDGVSNKIAAGKKVKLVASALPANASNQKYIWSSSNPKVATVNQFGIVTVKKKTGGKSVIITARAADGSGATATFRIKSMKGIVKKVTIAGTKKRTVKAGKKLKLKVKVTATKGANKKLIWTSSNTKYATVSASGKVKTKKAGKGKKVKITAMATDGSNKKMTMTIKLK